jgi:L-lactate dehydrogenase complex protein LldG
MTARDDILHKVRERLPVATELPDLKLDWTRYPEPRRQFASVLATVGGRCVEARDAVAAGRDLEQLPQYAAAKQRYSGVAGIGSSTLDLEAIDDPHQLADVDFAVLPGELAVAENGAVWVATDSVAERTLYFLSQHLALVVPIDRLVNNMHEAYARINVTRCRFGTFVSGPSKTADIEQSLVIGAHGARSLTVYLVGGT